MKEGFKNRKVFHGSPVEFDGPEAVPKRQIRSKFENGERVIKFDEESFHATPHEWIALAYTFSSKSVDNHSKKVSYTMGVNLYENQEEIMIYGIGTLEESLSMMYGDGGYLYHFDGEDFVYKKGLGDLEVISNDPVKPLKSEFIDDPVSKMKDLGVTFRFIDITRND